MAFGEGRLCKQFVTFRAGNKGVRIGSVRGVVLLRRHDWYDGRLGTL